MRASAKLTHMFECTVDPVTHFVCVPDVTGTIPVSVVKKGLTYDQSLRLLRARNNLPWQKPIDELFTKSVFPKRHFPQTFPNNAPNKYVPPTPLDFEDCFDMVIRLGPRVTDQGSSKSSLGNKSAKFMQSLFHIFSLTC
jgi:hypothetical protein